MGLLFARHDRAAVEALIAAEPFSQRGLAEVTLAEVDIMSTAPGLGQIKDGQTS